MKKKIILTITLAFCLPFLFCDFSLAEEKTQPERENKKNVSPPNLSEKISNIYLDEVKIVSQDKEKIKFSLNIHNTDFIQPEVSLGTELFRVEDGNIVIYDLKRFPESMTLYPEDIIEKEFEYNLPKNIDGEFSLHLVVYSPDGHILAIRGFDNIKLVSEKKQLRISKKDCFFQSGKEKYDFLEAGFYKEKAQITASCKVKNTSGENFKAVPYWHLSEKSLFGRSIGFERGEALELAPQEERSFSFLLPEIENSHINYATFGLMDSEGSYISNLSDSSYGVVADDATIVNVKSENGYPKENDEFGLYIFWKNFTDKNEKISPEVYFTNSLGEKCGETKSSLQIKEKDFDRVAKLYMRASKDCFDPKISVVLKDESGKIYDRSEYNIKSKKEKEENTLVGDEIDKLESARGKIYLVAFLIIAAVMAHVFYNKIKYKNIRFPVFFLVVFSGLLLFGPKAEAAIIMSEIDGDSIYILPAETEGSFSVTVSRDSSNIPTSLPISVRVELCYYTGCLESVSPQVRQELCETRYNGTISRGQTISVNRTFDTRTIWPNSDWWTDIYHAKLYVSGTLQQEKIETAGRIGHDGTVGTKTSWNNEDYYGTPDP